MSERIHERKRSLSEECEKKTGVGSKSHKIIGTAGYESFRRSFQRAVKASLDVRHLNVVVVSCLNELSLLSGLLAAFFGSAFFSGLFLSCHIVVSPS